MGKAPMSMSSYKRPHGNIGQSSHGKHISFGDNGIKGASNIKLSWGNLKDAKADFNSFEVV
jgi:hypothetical protein